MSSSPSLASDGRASPLARAAVLAFGTVTYALSLATFCYLIGWVTGLVVPKTIDSGAPGPVGASIAVDIGFLALFAVQHTIMARPGFKQRVTRLVPEPIERSVFVLLTSLILAAMAWQWRPLPEAVWSVEGPLGAVLLAVSLTGWGIALLATFLIDHFHLFGVRQALSFAAGRSQEEPEFREISLYKVCRHPLMLGLLIAFWATPSMTVGHLLFAGVTTVYIAAALQIEERTLIAMHGEAYRDYQRRVRMLLPIPR